MQVLAHNLVSQFTNRQLNITTKNKEKDTERLSSGYRINRSSDDAAGLSISEKMRWQIRGLNKGKNNIQDGMSLIDTADGALEETHSILQRVRELSIQAYNDTNTESDREAIQKEIDSCLKEIDRIAEDTTFNTKQILKGNEKQTIQVTGDENVDVVTTTTVTKDLPTWLDSKVDKKLEVHPSYNLPQDTSGVMLKYDGVNDSSKEYYGPANASVPGGYQHKGEWSNSISDNPSAKIDFSNLTSITKATDLYTALYELIGCKLAYPCGTCSTQVNSITFGGNEETLKTEQFENSAEVDVTGELNLSTVPFPYNGKTYPGYFSAVQDMLETYGANYDGDASTDIAGEDIAIKDLAECIARDLRDKTADILGSKMEGHFDRVVKGNDDYSLVVYDYRDNDKLTSQTAADTTVITSARVQYKTSVNMLVPGQTVVAESPMKIMCGALNSSYIKLGLENLSSSALGIGNYKINRYITQNVYSDSYQQKMQAWEDSAVEQTTTVSYTTKVPDTINPPIYGTKFENGERKTFLISAGSITYKDEVRSYKVTQKVYGPKPTANPGDIKQMSVYDPDSVDLIDNAIASVSSARSTMGAVKNRLEHAYNLNANTSENTQSAESRIRDADMAEEMVDYSKNNILEQAGQAMLAQANQSRQGILQLLQ